MADKLTLVFDTGILYADGGKTQLKNSRGPLSEHVLTPWKYSTNKGGHWSLEFFRDQDRWFTAAADEWYRVISVSTENGYP